LNLFKVSSENFSSLKPNSNAFYIRSTSSERQRKPLWLKFEASGVFSKILTSKSEKKKTGKENGKKVKITRLE